MNDDGTQENDALDLSAWSRDRLLVSLTSWGYDDIINTPDVLLRKLVREREVDRLLAVTQSGDVICDVCGDESNGAPDLMCGREPCKGTYRDRCEPEVRKSLVISTAHLTEADAALFRAGETGGLSITINSTKYGWQIWVGDCEREWEYTREDIDNAGFSTDLVAIAELAWKADCSYIVFDQDGPTTHLLPRYNW